MIMIHNYISLCCVLAKYLFKQKATRLLRFIVKPHVNLRIDCANFTTMLLNECLTNSRGVTVAECYCGSVHKTGTFLSRKIHIFLTAKNTTVWSVGWVCVEFF